MTREDAISLIKEYASALKFESGWTGEISTEHIASMADRLDDSFSTNKIMRWLGFVQGVVVENMVFSLEEVKQHSRTREVK